MMMLKFIFLSLIFIANFIAGEAIENITEIPESLIESSLGQPSSIDETLEKLDEELIHFIIFAFCDIAGNLKEIVLPAEQAQNVLKNGLFISKDTILIRPDLQTLRFLPWTTGIHRTAWFMCTMYENQTHQLKADPRAILASLNNKISDLGYKFNVGIELDFFLLEGNEHGSLAPSDQASYLDPEYNLSKQQELNLLIHALKDFNVNIETIVHGPSNGQWRITLKNDDVVRIADSVIAGKYILKVLTKQLRQHITFMPKPFSDKEGNKMPIKYTLIDSKKNKNAFYQAQEKFKLSTLAKNFLAGNLDRAIELTALFAPTVNSYKNGVPIFQKYNCWSVQNYNTLFNVISSDQEEREEELYIKCNMADSASNIYLTLASLLKSGIEGIKKSKKLNDPLPEECLLNTAISYEQEQALYLTIRPSNLSKALDHFEKSIFSKRLFSDSGHAHYLALKRTELAEYDNFITDWETKKYF